MRVIILGGTLFIGRRIALELLARGDDVMVLFRRPSDLVHRKRGPWPGNQTLIITSPDAGPYECVAHPGDPVRLPCDTMGMGSYRWKHRSYGAVTMVAIIWGAACLAGCSNSTSSTAGSKQSASSQITPTPNPTAAATSPVPVGATSGSSAAGNSTSAASNSLFPLKPGNQSVRQGNVNVGNRRLPHRRVYTITDVTKVVNGVTAMVALDQDFDGGELAEESLELLSLDKDGNVLYLGSYTEAYEGGQFVNSTDAWLSGIRGGKSGILVPGHPQVGPSFTQAVVPGEGPATARVVKTGEKRCVPFRCFNNIVVVEENGGELKYYAPGVGGILTVPLSDQPRETEELINVTTLSKTGLDEISAEVIKLDQHARTVSGDVYGHSTPARQTT